MANTEIIHELTADELRLKNNALIGYGLMLTGCFTLLFWLIGGVWAFVNKEQAKGTIFESHYKNMISVFIWSMVWSLVGLLTAFLLVGFVILFVATIWVLIRMVKGFSLANTNQAWK